MLVQDDVLAFLDGVWFGYLATRDAELRPQAHRIVNVVLSDDRRRLSVYVPETFALDLHRNVAASDQVAVSAGHPFTAQSFQFKGRARAIRPATPDDAARANERIEKAVALVATVGYPPEPIRAFLGNGVALVVEVDLAAVFDQTPGPKAGRAIEGAQP